MGMEINGAAAASSYQSQNTQAAKPVAKASNSTANKSNEVVAESSQSAVSSVAVSIGQAAESERSGNNAYNNEQAFAKKEKKEASSMGEIKEINKLINNNTIAEFSYNEPTKRIAIKIKDKDTDEVIKEIPSEKALEMLAKAWELAGILVDERR